MYKNIKYTVLIVGLFALIGCQNKREPNYQYMPNMYEPVGFKTYAESDAFPNGQEALLPAEESVSRGYMPYEIPNTNEGYKQAKASLKSPLDSTEVNMDKAKELYQIYCGVCHGNKGNGQGILAKREKIPGVPSYADVGRAITEGSIYHVIHYGRNSMGSYANQLNENERWQVVAYVEKLKADLEK